MDKEKLYEHILSLSAYLSLFTFSVIYIYAYHVELIKNTTFNIEIVKYACIIYILSSIPFILKNILDIYKVIRERTRYKKGVKSYLPKINSPPHPNIKKTDPIQLDDLDDLIESQPYDFLLEHAELVEKQLNKNLSLTYNKNKHKLTINESILIYETSILTAERYDRVDFNSQREQKHFTPQNLTPIIDVPTQIEANLRSISENTHDLSLLFFNQLIIKSNTTIQNEFHTWLENKANSVPFNNIYGIVTRIPDGDGLEVSLDIQIDIRIRLSGIDAPELFQEYGAESQLYLATLTEGKLVRVNALGVDHYGRIIADIYLNETWVNCKLVENGYAWFYSDYSSNPILKHAENQARGQRIGLWKQPNPIPPWAYRRNKQPKSQNKRNKPTYTKNKPASNEPSLSDILGDLFDSPNKSTYTKNKKSSKGSLLDDAIDSLFS